MWNRDFADDLIILLVLYHVCQIMRRKRLVQPLIGLSVMLLLRLALLVTCKSLVWIGLLFGIPFLVLASQLHIHRYNRSLARDNKHGVEKEQVLKLIRWIVALGSQSSRRTNLTPQFRPETDRVNITSDDTSRVPLSEPVMRAMIAVAEYPEDPFRLACLLTLAEIGEAACVVRSSG